MLQDLLIIFLAFIIINLNGNNVIKKYSIITSVNIVDLNLESATSSIETSNGLMWRKSLHCDGMLFFFTHPQILYFWMKETYIPLDIIFFDQNKKIIKIYTNAAPQDIKLLSSNTPAQYVIELKAGEVEKLGLTIGDILKTN